MHKFNLKYYFFPFSYEMRLNPRYQQFKIIHKNIVGMKSQIVSFKRNFGMKYE